MTRAFLKAQGREGDWVELLPDADAEYDEEITIDLGSLEPLAAKPHSPDNVEAVSSIGAIKVDQVAIGSCTNSSYMDMIKVAKILKGKTVHPDVSLVIAPGSETGTDDAGERRGSGGYGRCGSKDPGISLWSLYRYGAGSGDECGLAENFQQELRGKKRYQICQGIPGEPGNCRSKCTCRRSHRSADTG